MGDESTIGLAELINKVKHELLSSETGEEENIPLFSVDEVELELQVTVTKQAGGGLSIHVIELGGQAERDDLQKVRIVLTPLLDKEERLQYFKTKYPERWKTLQEAQIEATVKGPGQESLDDLYGK